MMDQQTLLEILSECGGYYICPKDKDGKRLGPLVAYAGRDDLGRQFVGDGYVNFAVIEENGRLLKLYATLLNHLREKFSRQMKIDNDKLAGFCGTPEGGKSLACMMATMSERSYIYPEKETAAIATATSREISRLVFARHKPGKGSLWWIVDDVCNNFSTAKEMMSLIEDCEASVIGILCFLNRSLDVDKEYRPCPDLILPVVALVRHPIMEYRQDDPEVAEDVKRGNVIWKPKNERDKLSILMDRWVGVN